MNAHPLCVFVLRAFSITSKNARIASSPVSSERRLAPASRLKSARRHPPLVTSAAMAQVLSRGGDSRSAAPGADPLNQVTRLPAPSRLFLAGNTVSMVGNGLVIPYPLIYLHHVRGIDLPVVGALLAGAAIAGLIVVPISGALIDRVGARRVLVALILGQAVAEVLFALAH